MNEGLTHSGQLKIAFSDLTHDLYDTYKRKHY